MFHFTCFSRILVDKRCCVPKILKIELILINKYLSECQRIICSLSLTNVQHRQDVFTQNFFYRF